MSATTPYSANHVNFLFVTSKTIWSLMHTKPFARNSILYLDGGILWWCGLTLKPIFKNALLKLPVFFHQHLQHAYDIWRTVQCLFRYVNEVAWGEWSQHIYHFFPWNTLHGFEYGVQLFFDLMCIFTIIDTEWLVVLGNIIIVFNYKCTTVQCVCEQHDNDIKLGVGIPIQSFFDQDQCKYGFIFHYNAILYQLYCKKNIHISILEYIHLSPSTKSKSKAPSRWNSNS